MKRIEPLYLRPAQAAKRIGVELQTLVYWRAIGKGPPYRQTREQALCRYDRVKLEKWITG